MNQSIKEHAEELTERAMSWTWRNFTKDSLTNLLIGMAGFVLNKTADCSTPEQEAFEVAKELITASLAPTSEGRCIYCCGTRPLYSPDQIHHPRCPWQRLRNLVFPLGVSPPNFCCAAACENPGAVQWNEFNKLMQCHACGRSWVPDKTKTSPVRNSNDG